MAQMHLIFNDFIMCSINGAKLKVQNAGDDFYVDGVEIIEGPIQVR